MKVRDDLVRAGVELLEVDGLAGLSQRQIAIRAGVSHGAPRHHFPTYSALLAAIARAGIDDLDALITDGMSDADPRAAVVATCERVIHFAIARPGMFELIARHDLLEGAGGHLRETTGQWLKTLAGRVSEARPDATLDHTIALWSGVQGLGVMVGRRSAEAITAQTIDTDAVIRVIVEGVIGPA